MFKSLKESFSKIKAALSKTKSALASRIAHLFKNPWNEETFEEFEKILFEADIGTECSLEWVDETRVYLKKHKDATQKDILSFLHSKGLEILEKPTSVKVNTPKPGDPKVILVVGVNGSGKTTSIAKLAHLFQNEGKSVLLAAGDTFRAAAIEQLTAWAERLHIPIIKSSPGGDPASVAFDSIQAAKSRNMDTLIIDTAGRLQNKSDLMRELEKILRVMKKIIPDAPHEILLVLDATTGQNAIDQAEIFNSVAPLTGIILAKLDGSAKGGIILSIYKKLGIPVRFVGVGEKLDDLVPFDKIAYLDGLFATEI